MTLREVLSALRAAWWLPLIGGLVGATSAMAMTLLQTPLYTSTTQFFVSTTGSTSTSDVYQGSQFSKERATSYAQLITGDQLAARVITRLGLDMATEELKQEISATAVNNTVLIDVSVTDPSPERAQAIAAAIGTEFSALATELERTDEGGPSPVKVTVTDQPVVPTNDSSPRTKRSVALGMFIGVLAGAGLVIGRARLDHSDTDANEAAGAGRRPRHRGSTSLFKG
jgi:capsular polysaccharide biosynthesis protein